MFARIVCFGKGVTVSFTFYVFKSGLKMINVQNHFYVDKRYQVSREGCGVFCDRVIDCLRSFTKFKKVLFCITFVLRFCERVERKRFLMTDQLLNAPIVEE